MWPFNQQNWKYSKANVESADDNDENHQSAPTTIKERASPQTKNSCIFALSIVTCVACGFLLVYLLGRSYLISRKPATAISCQNPRIRREWRTLSHAEKHQYLDAVTCLRHTPSRINPNLSLYDDFPYVHDRIASYGQPILSTILIYG
jgi:hypothetical protein